MSLTVNSKTVSTTKYIFIVDRKNNGTDGGTFTSGAWRTRDLNSIDVDETGSVSLSSNQFTLPAGTYRCKIRTPAYLVDSHRSKLYNITDSVDVLFSESGSIGSNSQVHQVVEILGKFTIAASKTFEVRHICGTTESTDGFGKRSQIASLSEVYSTVELWKVEEVSTLEVFCQ